MSARGRPRRGLTPPERANVSYAPLDTIRALASSPEMVIPGHDPLVLELLKKVGDGIVEL